MNNKRRKRKNKYVLARDPFADMDQSVWESIFSATPEPETAPPTTRRDQTDDDKPDVLEVYQPGKQKTVARVVLNGYNIERGQVPQQRGAMRSFKVIAGNLWNDWNAQSQLILRTRTGKEALIKIAALPVEEDGYGLLEFL
jgi:hypothetical protein